MADDGGRTAWGVGRSLERQLQHQAEAIIQKQTPARRASVGIQFEKGIEGWEGGWFDERAL